MTRYIGARLLAAIPVALGVATVVFIVIRLSGDPVDLMLTTEASREEREALRHQLGLDQPPLVQYALWLTSALTGDLGHSLVTGEAVTDMVFRRIGPTFILAVTSLAIACVVGVTLGVLAGTRPRSWIDRASTTIAAIGVSTPTFWLGLMLVALFAVHLAWLPSGGMFSPLQPDWTDVPRHLLLPALTLAFPSVAVITRLTRASMLEIMRQEYVRTARAKGLREWHVVARHALRNALVSVVTIVGLQFGHLLGGTIIVEAVFGWPGVGTLMLHGISTRDFPLVQGAVLYVAVGFVLVSLAVDLLYGYLNPRIRYG